MNPGRRGVLLAVAGVAIAGHFDFNSTEALLMSRQSVGRRPVGGSPFCAGV